jgi:hypothetical protein
MLGGMTKLLDKAFKAAAKLPAEAQDALGSCILEEVEVLKDEAGWEERFAKTQRQLSRWADEVLAEIRSGKTVPFAFDRRRK